MRFSFRVRFSFCLGVGVCSGIFDCIGENQNRWKKKHSNRLILVHKNRKILILIFEQKLGKIKKKTFLSMSYERMTLTTDRKQQQQAISTLWSV